MLISLIIPVYNKEKYLDECIKSAVSQSYSNIEIIVIDDGSQDKSNRIIKKWALKDPRIKYFFQENRGVAITRNRGISIAKGDYIFFLDADDVLEKHAIFEFVKCAEQTKADIITANFHEKKGDKLIKKPSFKDKLYQPTVLNSTEVILEMFIINERHMAKAGNKLYNKDFINEHNIRFVDGVIAEDRLFNLMCYVNKPKLQVINEYTYVYNILDDSRSRTFKSKFYDESIALLKYFYNYLRKESKLDSNFELFELIILYDVFRIINLTYEYSNKKIQHTKYNIRLLREEPIVINTLTKLLKQKKFKKIKAGSIFFRMRLINCLLIKAPNLIIFYKLIGYITSGIRKSLPK